MISTPFAVALALLAPAGMSFIIDKVMQGSGDKWSVVLCFLAGLILVLVRLGLVNL